MNMSLEGEIKVKLSREEEYQFIVSFSNDKISNIRMDEPQPLGDGNYPNAGSLLAAAVGNCLCSSLLFCLQKSRIDVDGMQAEVSTTVVRNELGHAHALKR